jgi:phage gpG-like protein
MDSFDWLWCVLMAYQSQTGTIVIGTRELERLAARIKAAAETDLFDFLDAVGQTIEDSARRRITSTKRAPNGTRWKPWSAGYAATRGPQHSLLRNEGHLGDSMDHYVDAGDSSVHVGSNLVYAGRMLFGDDGFVGPVRGGGRIPARPYLDTDGGFADPLDREELRDLARDFLGGLV